MIAERMNGIRRAKSRIGQSPCAIRMAANRKVVELQTKRHRVEQRTPARKRIVKETRIAIFIQAETEVDSTGLLRVVRKNDEILSGTDYGVGRKRSEEHTSELQSLAYLVCR